MKKLLLVLLILLLTFLLSCNTYENINKIENIYISKIEIISYNNKEVITFYHKYDVYLEYNNNECYITDGISKYKFTYKVISYKIISEKRNETQN